VKTIPYINLKVKKILTIIKNNSIELHRGGAKPRFDALKTRRLQSGRVCRPRREAAGPFNLNFLIL
jgi:hypothetical protein